MTPSRPLSDLVRDKKIEAEVSETSTKHTFYLPGRSARERQIRRVEIWVRDAYLGQGSFGTVYREKCEEGPRQNELRAVKEIKKRVAAGEELDYTRELEAIIKFSNPRYSHCFVPCNGWFESNDSVFISMDYHKLGDLQNYLTQPLHEHDAQEITCQVLEGLQIMHEHDFVHRDLKPGNIMVVEKRPWFVKIADFGISKRRLKDVTALRTLQRGTYGYAAPEIFGVGNDSEDGSYTPAVDMWSLGAVAYRIFTGVSPFPDVSTVVQYGLGHSPFPSSSLKAHQISEHGIDFINKLLAPKAKDRLTAAAAQKHKWMKMHIDAPFDALSTIDPSSDLYVGNSISSEGSGQWTMDHTINRLPVTMAEPVTTQQELPYRSPYLEDDMADVGHAPRVALPKDSPVLLREATITTTDWDPVPSDLSRAEASTAQPGDENQPSELSESGSDTAADDYSEMIAEAVNESSATFMIDKFMDFTEDPNRSLSNEDYYPTACKPLKRLLYSHPQVLDTHRHILEAAIDAKTDPDVRLMLRKAIVDVLSTTRWDYEGGSDTVRHQAQAVAPKGDHREGNPDAVRQASASTGYEYTSRKRCFECEDSVACSMSLEMPSCLHILCHPCIKRKFRLAVKMPISRNMPPKCCTEDPIRVDQDVVKLFDAYFWAQWNEEVLDDGAWVVRVKCPNTGSRDVGGCKAIIAFDRNFGRDPECRRCGYQLCRLCDMESHPGRTCDEDSPEAIKLKETASDYIVRSRSFQDIHRPRVRQNDKKQERSRQYRPKSNSRSSNYGYPESTDRQSPPRHFVDPHYDPPLISRRLGEDDPPSSMGYRRMPRA